MWEFIVSLEWEFILRLLVSALVGVAIGFERKLRFKEAGMRTHAIVSLGSCLLMLVSLSIEGSDKGRIAAQIVSGIGFLGAGMIMFKNQGGIQGLTTAAGIWVTAGIGMAIGNGMYLLGIGGAVLMILVQCVFHLPVQAFKTKRYVQIKVTFEDDGNGCEKVLEIFGVKTFIKLKATKTEEKVTFVATILTDKIHQAPFIRKVLNENSFIKNIERVEND